MHGDRRVASRFVVHRRRLGKFDDCRVHHPSACGMFQMHRHDGRPVRPVAIADAQLRVEANRGGDRQADANTDHCDAQERRLLRSGDDAGENQRHSDDQCEACRNDTRIAYPMRVRLVLCDDGSDVGASDATIEEEHRC